MVILVFVGLFGFDWQVSIEMQLKELPVCTLMGTKPVNDPGKCQNTFQNGFLFDESGPERAEPLFHYFLRVSVFLVTVSGPQAPQRLNFKLVGCHFSASCFKNSLILYDFHL